jgi:hypothetical protein
MRYAILFLAALLTGCGGDAAGRCGDDEPLTLPELY